MKISILLPYKENFSPIYPGAVSLFVNDTVKESKFKKKIIVYGNTDYKKTFKCNYVNIPLNKSKLRFTSQSKKYIKEFTKIELNEKSDLIEIHNRPNYLYDLIPLIGKRNYILYFHNDPLTMLGSKTIKERKFLLKNTYKILFNSNWSKKRFVEGMQSKFINSEKLSVIFQSAKKSKFNIKNKKNLITFVGKLNKAKGYDIFGNTIIKILNNFKDWRASVVGDEARDKIYFNHKHLKIHGFLEHKKVLKIYENTSIAVVCSRWEEPFGRTSLEASSRGSAVIISKRGGLPETTKHPIILKDLTSNNLFNEIELLIRKPLKLLNLQKSNYK